MFTKEEAIRSDQPNRNGSSDSAKKGSLKGKPVSDFSLLGEKVFLVGDKMKYIDDEDVMKLDRLQILN
jgi:hypothetical protein